VVIRDLETGAVVREGNAKHPDGTEVDPRYWWEALGEAIEKAGGLDGVEAISVGAQQHGMVVVDDQGRVIRDALLWNDTRSAKEADDLVAEFGADFFASETGSVPVASFTITKLRWLRDHEPDNAKKVAAVCLPHDWLTWRLMGYGPAGESERGPDLTALVTDRSDASGTGYFNPATNDYSDELITAALGHRPVLPRIVAPGEKGGETPTGIAVACGAGDNAAAALGLGAKPGDVVVSIGTSGTVFSVSALGSSDSAGLVAGFADASGVYLPLACTLNAARVLDKTRELLGVNFDEFETLALSAESGSGGIVLVPYFEGERTPNLPDASGSVHGVTLSNWTPANLARSAVEGVLLSLAHCLIAVQAEGVVPERILIIGGAAKNRAVQAIAPTVFPYPIVIPETGEYVAWGAAVQAAWVAKGSRPGWEPQGVSLPRGGYSQNLARNYVSLVERLYLSKD
jgi:xylulokinase